MKVIPLGTNGYFSSFNRQTACYVIPYNKRLIIFDAGSGLFRLAEPVGKKILKGVDDIDLFLSHYHLDHTFGFYGAFKFFEGKKVTVYGSHQKQVFSEFVKLKHFPVDYSKEHKNFTWRTLREGSHKISDYRVFVRKQFHRREGSLAFRLEFPNGKSMAYVTDSEPTGESIKFVRSVDLLLHEQEKAGEKSGYNKRVKLEELYEDGHVTTEGAALIVEKAKAGKLYLIHHNPFLDNRDLKLELTKARKIFKESYLAMDLEEIEF